MPDFAVGPIRLKNFAYLNFDDSKELHCNNLLLLTWDTEETAQYNGYTIPIVPASKWFF